MAITKLNSLAIPDDTIVEADLSYPLTNFSSTGIDDNATSTAITIDASENVSMTGGVLATSFAVNNNSGNAPLQIHTVDSNSAYMQFTNATTGDTASNGLVVGFDGNEDAYVWQYETKALYFGTTNTERARIDSSGHLLIGKDSTALNTSGAYIAPSGVIVATRDSAEVLALNLTNSDGNIASFYKDGSTVGSIGAASNGLYIGSDDAGIFFNDHGGGDLDAIFPYDVGTNTFYNGHVDIGGSSNKFRNIHISGSLSTGDGVTFGSTGGSVTSKTLDDYEEGTWTPAFQHGGTLTVNNAVYTKIGRQVVASCYISNFANIPNDLNGFKITGLPFNNGIASNYGGGSLSYAATSVVDNWSDPLVIQLGNYIYFHYLDGSTGNDVRNANVFQSVSVLILQVIYFTA